MTLFKIMALGFMAAGPALAADLGGWLADTGALWGATSAEFQAQWGAEGFQWTSSDRTSARNAERGMTFLGESLSETLVYFGGGRAATARLSLYNRGDSGELDKIEFLARVDRLVQKLTGATGRKPDVVAEPPPSIGVRRETLAWRTPTTEIGLVWSYSSKDAMGGFVFRSEFIRVDLAAAGAAAAPVAVAPALPSRVERRTNGDIIIRGVPMVDQGEKGYCAVAVAERVMQYYGLPSDQHEIAQLVGSSPGAGTDPNRMVDVLKRTGSKQGCRVRVLEEWDFQSFDRLLRAYNRAAKSSGLETIKTGKVVNLSDVYRRFDTAVLREVRLKDEGSVKKFVGMVTEMIGRGVPLVWSVALGKVPEIPPANTEGSHMRLIIGLNSRLSEILYTDSWGAGHEEKRMSLADAWTITQGLYVIEPRR